jgi:hypothetical protein
MNCSGCQRTLPDDAVLCVHCGLDFRSGRRLTAASVRRVEPQGEPLDAPLRLYEGFTGQARRAVHLAHREAERLHHDYLGTEHLLLGALQEGSGGLVQLLAASGTDPERVYREVAPKIAPGSGESRWDQLPLTPSARRTFNYAREEAANLHHRCVGPEHLLLAVLREPDCQAVDLLAPLGLTTAALREAARSLPEPENRDWQLRPEATPPAGAKTDPSAGELDRVVTANPLPRTDRIGTVVGKREVRTQITPPSPPPVEAGFDIVRFQLVALQFLVALVAGGFVGAVQGGPLGMLFGWLCGVFVVLLRNVYLSGILGALVGLDCGRRLVFFVHGGEFTTRNPQTELTALILGGLFGLVVGVLVGDWRTLRRPR